MLRFSLLLLLAGCSSGITGSDADVTAADLGAIELTEPSVMVGDNAQISASGVPEGATYSWALHTVPPLSHATIDDSALDVGRFMADRAGAYVVELTVTVGDVETYAVSVVTAMLTEDAPEAKAGNDRMAILDYEVQLSGQASTDPNDLWLDFDWQLIEGPGDIELVDWDQEVASFIPTATGDYTFELTVHNGSLASEPDQVLVTVLDEIPVNPGDVANGVFNPDEVYIFGEVVDSSCSPAIAHWDDPSIGTAGFSCYVYEASARIRPDGKLQYIGDDEIWMFAADGTNWAPGDTYPVDPTANDTKLDTSANCDVSLDYRTHRADFENSPPGDTIYTCDGTWYDEAGTEIYYGWDSFYSYSDSGHALTGGGVLDTKTGLMAGFLDFVDTYDYSIRTVRNAPQGGFWVVVTDWYGGGNPELWHVDTDGWSTLQGVYPEPPVNYEGGHYNYALDVHGQLFHTAYGLDYNDAVVKRSLLSNNSEVVFDEDDGWGLTVGYGALITGP